MYYHGTSLISLLFGIIGGGGGVVVVGIWITEAVVLRTYRPIFIEFINLIHKILKYYIIYNDALVIFCQYKLVFRPEEVEILLSKYT